MNTNFKLFLRLTYTKYKAGLPWVVALLICVGVGQLMGAYLWKHSQQSRVFVVQNDLLSGIMRNELPKAFNQHELDLIYGAKDGELCSQTLHYQTDELTSSLENSDNSCSANVTYDQVMSPKKLVNPADIIEKYLPLLQNNCK